MISTKIDQHLAKELRRERPTPLADGWLWVEESFGGSSGVVKVLGAPAEPKDS